MSIGNVLVRDAGPLLAAEPPVNLVRAALVERLGTPVLAVCGQQVPVPGLLRLRPSLRRHLGRPVVFGVRPEHLQDALVGRPAAAGPAVLVLHGVVRRVRPDGAHRVVHVELADVDSGQLPVPTMVARVSRHSSAGVGDAIMVAVDTQHLMMFDADSGRSLW
ncbi:TOBE domain-containing protein [Dactylosporangium sp. NPDC048998]|uniref:TOBE domain-containing protein n=1 Tax=Dactylosporangium sp. NPDC048998 TaxID=3363976 RepID=UPI00371A4648